MDEQLQPERSALSALPRIDDLVAAAGPLRRRYGSEATTEALRATVDVVRQHIRRDGGEVPADTVILGQAGERLEARFPGPLVPVVNATGVVLHTNLGRAPLSTQAVAALHAAAGYCDVELDLTTGRRGGRGARLGGLIAAITRAEAAIAVNNGAAALVLALAALAAGRQVPVGRGELVEIGGSFRLPEIMAASGARLLEVGTTNRTRAVDYRAGDDVALLLKVHPSNYEIRGFAEAPGVAELATVARDRGVPLVYDVGSGVLSSAGDDPLRGEPSVRGALAAGADLVVCSGDKLLGGPQAGLLAGRADLIAACARSPLARALRLDKLRSAALVATLESHLRGALEELPVWRMLRADPARLAARSERLAAAVGGTVAEGTALVGGGAAPGARLPGPVVRLALDDAADAVARLRAGRPPIIARIEGDAVVVDLRTVGEDDDPELASRLAALAGPNRPG